MSLGAHSPSQSGWDERSGSTSVFEGVLKRPLRVLELPLPLAAIFFILVLLGDGM